MTTPNINQLLALPFKKREVKNREQFLGIWTANKEYVRKVTGAKGTYQANKALRLSEEFKWPDISPSYPGVCIFYSKLCSDQQSISITVNKLELVFWACTGV